MFKAERPETAADEVIRWGTPVTAFQRTALADTELGGQQIKAGDRLGLFYRSANFDEEVFDHPERFDITRNPNPHLGLGGMGAHYCLGASLAKMEIGLIFNAIADAMPNIRLAQRDEAAASHVLAPRASVPRLRSTATPRTAMAPSLRPERACDGAIVSPWRPAMVPSRA
jgi:cholest-4-en-3-one 26-monooxygenase